MKTKTALTWLVTQLRKELTIPVTDKQFERAQQIVDVDDKPTEAMLNLMRGNKRKSASEKINESRALKTGLNGFAMFVLICLGVAVLVF